MVPHRFKLQLRQSPYKVFILASTLILGLLNLPFANPAHASLSLFPTPPGVAANVYMAAPYVQASYASSVGTTETFDNFVSPPLNGGGCPTTLTIGVISDESDCRYWKDDPYFGGATTSDPSIHAPGGAHSQYVSSQTSTGTTITFNTSVNYLGFWWSAGSTGNRVNFFDENGNEIARLNADQVYALLSHGGTLHSIDGQSNYSSDNYYGHPADPTRYDSNEPFSYFHILTSNGTKIKSIKFWTLGNGFELDNITIANFSSNIPSEIVDPSSVLVASLMNDYTQVNYNQLKIESQNGTQVPSEDYIDGEPFCWTDEMKANFESSHPGYICHLLQLPTLTKDSSTFLGWFDPILDPTFSAPLFTDVNYPYYALRGHTIVAGWTSRFSYSASTGGTISGESIQNIAPGLTGTEVHAVSLPGYKFVKWSDNDSTDPYRTDTATGRDITTTALFSIISICNFPYSSVNSEKASPIFIKENGDLIADYIVIGDDWNSTPIDIGFSMQNTETNDTASISTNGTMQIGDTTFGVLDSDLITTWSNSDSGTWQNFGSNYLAPKFDLCSLNEAFVAVGKSTIDGNDAFIVTWYKMHPYGESYLNIFSTFQIAIIKTISGIKIIRNYEFINSNISISTPYINSPSFYGPDIPNPYLSNNFPHSENPFQGFSSAYPNFATGPNDLTNDSRGSPILGRYLFTLPNGTNTLNYAAGSGGTLIGEHSQIVNDGQNGTQITAVPNTGYHFVMWSDNESHDPVRTDQNITANIAATAIFALNPGPFTFDYSAGDGGSIIGTTNQLVNYLESGTAVEARPDSGFHFIKWSDNSANATRMDSDASGDLTVKALFAPNVPTFTGLSSNAGPSGASIKLLGSSLSRKNSDGILRNFGYQTVFYSGFNGEGWSDFVINPIPDGQIVNNSDGTLSVQIPSGFMKIAYHVDWCPDYEHPNYSSPIEGIGNCLWPSDVGIHPESLNAEYIYTIQYSLNYSAHSNGSIAGNLNQYVNSGQSGSSITATPATGYKFVKWSDNSTANPRIDSDVNSNISVEALFEEIPVSLPPAPPPSRYIPPAPSTVVTIPQPSAPPIVITQPFELNNPELPPKPKREITVSKKPEKTVVEIKPMPPAVKPSITNTPSNIEIKGLFANQRIKVTITNLNGSGEVFAPTTSTELTKIVNRFPKSNVKIEIIPTLNQTLTNGAAISIKGAKKHDRVRVIVK